MSSALFVVCYPTADAADEVLKVVRHLHAAHLLRLEDSVIVRRTGDGQLSINVSHRRRAKNVALGAVVGALLGKLLGAPLLGGGVGAATGGLSAGVTENIIDEGFAQELAQYLGPESSALFVLVQRESPDQVLIAPEKVVPELGRFGGTVLHTTLTSEQDDRLQADLDEAHHRAEYLQSLTTPSSIGHAGRDQHTRAVKNGAGAAPADQLQ